MRFDLGGLRGPFDDCCGLLWLLAWVVCIFNIVGSRSTAATKVLWIVACLLLGPIGLLLWFVVGPTHRDS